jgi:oligosaccharide reducing-end xylanase
MKRYIAIVAVFFAVLCVSCENLFVNDILPDRTQKTKSFTVTFDKNHPDATEADPNTMIVTEPATTVGSLPADPTCEDWNFVGWNTDRNGNGTPFTGDTAVTADITVYAQWIQPGFLVRFALVDEISGDSITLSPSSGEIGDTITITYTIAGGYLHNRLVFEGTTATIAQVNVAGTGTRTYVINESDATSGIITIQAIFTHTNLELDTIAFADNVLDKTYGDASFTEALTNSGAGSGAISYSSVNQTIATVNETTGEVTILNAGSSVIRAVKESDGTYERTQASYTLRVSARQLTISDPVVTPTKTYDGNATAAFTIGTLTNVVGSDNVTVTASATYNSPNVAEANQITVVYSISGTDAHNYTKPVNYPIAGTITRAEGGALASAPEAVARYSSIIIKAISPPTGQTVEYAVSTLTETPVSGWQDGPVFSGLVAETDYYAYARAKENGNYTAGPARKSELIRTLKEPPVPPIIVDFEADTLGSANTYTVTNGNGSGTLTVITDPINAGEKSLRINVTGYNRAAIIPIRLPYTLQSYESISFRINIQSGTDLENKSVMVYAAGSPSTFVNYGFGNPAGGSNPQMENLLAGQTESIDFSAGHIDTWTTYVITPLDPGAAISNLKGNIFIAIGFNCNNATYLLDDLTFNIRDDFEPPPPPPPAPVPPSVGAVSSKNYRNMFKELGKTDAEIDAKVQDTWNKLFTGSETNRIFYPVGTDMAYILDVNNNDVRSEGMSYGMMMAVQMDEQEVFDRLWKWARTNMYNPDKSGKNQRGYFAWQCNRDGSKKDAGAAPDGEFYFVTSLLFASARWGDGTGIFEYRKHAMQLLYDMLHRFPPVGQDPGLDSYEAKSMFNPTNNMPVFVPYGNSADHTDPSYHLPAFYEVWAIEMEQDANANKTWGIWSDATAMKADAAFYKKAVQASREFFPKTTNTTTGLGPDYATFAGAPTGSQQNFEYDAWRIAMNIAVDYAWWAADDWQKTFADRIQTFFQSKGIGSYGNRWTLTGTQLGTDHSPGLVACNAVASLAATHERAWEFLDEFWDISMTPGQFRYYDGCLYMLGLLHVTGNFKAYLSGSTVITPNSSISPTTTTFDKYAPADIPITVTLNGNTLARISNGATDLTIGTHYTDSGSTVTLKKEYLTDRPVGTTTLTFVFSAGSNRTLTVTIADTTPVTNISPTTATFDKREDLQADIDVTMNLYGGNTFTSIQNGGTTLTSGTHYTVSSNTVTLKKEYLATLSVGSTTLIFNFSGGVSKTIVITIKQTAAGVTPGAVSTSFDFSTLSEVTVTYTSTGLNATLNNGALKVVKSSGYSTEAIILTFDLGSETLSNYTGVRYEIRAITGDFSYKDVKIEVANTAGGTFGSFGNNTALVAQHQINLVSSETAPFTTYSRPFSAAANVLSRNGQVQIAFGLNNAPTGTYELKKIELYK